MKFLSFFKTILIIGTIGFMTGCAGTHISEEQFNNFTEGVDTRLTIAKNLGKPWKSEYTGSTYTEYRHSYDVYTYAVSSIISKELGYITLTVFVYNKNQVLETATQITCYTQASCQDDLDDYLYPFVVSDLDYVQKTVKNKQEKQALAQKKLQEEKAQTARKQRIQQQSKKSTQTVISKKSTIATVGGTSATANSTASKATKIENSANEATTSSQDSSNTKVIKRRRGSI